ncbi:MAG: transglycosylase SLT domain-containing protein, partial [Desulfovibrio sp.]|nr:transglycosylase SLT domain-containing protein [Desulfovibrio sp.]
MSLAWQIRSWGMNCCLMVTACCLLLLGGCASQQTGGRASVSPTFVVPKTNGSVVLSGNELAALQSTGQLDRHIPNETMADVTSQYAYFLRQGRNSMRTFSKRAERYLAYSRKVFHDRGMPEELAYLAIVESGYRPDAKSPVGAAGAWQFMPFTGERFDLSQDWWTDERLDPYEATEAAATYLQKLYATFGDWPTAIAAYNAGEGKIGKAMQETGSSNYYEVKARNNQLDEKIRLREETKQYVPRFLAVSKIMRNLPQLGFDAISPDETQSVVRFTAKPGTDLQGLAHACRMDWEHFSELNRHHKRRITHNARETYVYVPEGRAREAKDFLNSPTSTVYAGWTPCTIASNAESWDKISHRCRVPVAQLRAINPDVTRLRVGDVVLLPHTSALALNNTMSVDRATVSAARNSRPREQGLM